MPRSTLKRAIKSIRQELEWWEPKLIEEGKLVEAQRCINAPCFDLEMMKEMGFLPGHRKLFASPDRKEPGEPPPTLLDYLPRDTLVVIDESHQTIPQVRGMFFGDQSRKRTLVEYGFRLPSALDNRPLNFEEFEERVSQRIYVSATARSIRTHQGERRNHRANHPAHGLMDPEVEVLPSKAKSITCSANAG